MEMVGITKDVMDVLEKYMSSKLCANTVGQVKKSSCKAATNLLIVLLYDLNSTLFLYRL